MQELAPIMSRRTAVTTVLALALSPYVLTAADADLAKPLSSQERAYAVTYLTETRTGVFNAVKGLSDAQWRFKPAPDRWSIAEVVEHLAIVEPILTKQVLVNLDTAPPASADALKNAKEKDAAILAKVPDRSTKFQAPAEIQPTGRFTPTAGLHQFQDERNQTIALVKSIPDLRGHVIAHPALGPLDGYQWVLAIAAHSERHTKQILEVKADPNFPRE